MASGILNLAPKQDQVATYTPAQAVAERPQVTTYDANPFKVTKEQTVAGQLDSIMAKDSPLLQQARTRAAQQSAERGMLNSSLAIGAGEQAVLSQALPIATEDSGRYFTANTNTVNAQNAAKYANMQADNAARLRSAELGTNVNLANADAKNKALSAEAGTANQFRQIDMETARALQLADKEFERAMGTAQLDANTRIQLASMDHNTRMELANVDRNTRVELATIENNYRQLLQMNQDLAAMYNQVSTNIANIATSNLSAEAKRAATDSQMNILVEALKAKQGVVGTSAHTGTTPSGGSAPVVSNLNIGQYFNRGTSVLTGDPNFDQAGYDAALRNWQIQEELHQSKYGVPIPKSAYRPDYRPPSKADFYRAGTGSVPGTPSGGYTTPGGSTAPGGSIPTPSPVTNPRVTPVTPTSAPPPGYYRDSRGQLWPLR